jgi:hypothetical protein
MRRTDLLVLLGAAVTACAHDSEGHAVRTGKARFDAQTVTGPTGSITLNDDGSWGSSRIRRVGNQLQSEFIGGFNHYGGYVQVDDLPDGVRYTPSFYSGPIWTFVTEDGKPIPANLEIPLYLAAGIGLGGHWVATWTPAQDDRGPQLQPDCGLVLFEMQGRQVAGWVARQGADCPGPQYPGREMLARLVYGRNEVWESPLRPLP